MARVVLVHRRVVSGLDFLLGTHGSAASKAEYRRLTAEWLASKGMPPTAVGSDHTVSELILAFWRHAHPHQLRHNVTTRLRKKFGLEAAQVILSHKTLSVTEIYAEKNVEAAKRIMAQVG